MKKLLLSIIFSLMLLTSVSAGETDSRVYQLKDSSGVNIESYVMTSGVPVQTRELYMKDNIGFTALLVTVDVAGDVDIYAEYSEDGTNWYKAYESNMDGTATIDGNIIDTVANETQYIQFTSRLATLMRIVFDPDANSTVSAKLIYQKDR